MKTSLLSAALALASLSARTMAVVTLGPFPDLVEVGSEYTLSWTATLNYTYTLWLVVQTAGEGGYGWSKAQGLDTSMEFDYLEGSYAWTVPANLSSHSTYSLWLDGFAIPFNGSTYVSMTDWFRVSFANYDASTSSSSTSTPATTSTSTPTQSHSATITLTPTSFPSSTSSSDTSSPSSHLSGGAIAGIVIGILLLLALLIGGFIFMKWRNKRAAQQKREAAARDSRLAPVMRVGTEQGDFELDGRNPQANKDFAV